MTRLTTSRSLTPCCAVLLALGLCCLSVSCMVAGGNAQTGQWAIAAAGVDADKLSAGATGMTADKVNMSKGFAAALKTVENLWKAYLTLQGFEFIAGKYYDHLGNELSATTSVKLEELRNANSVDMARIKLEELEILGALEAGAGA